MMPSFSTTSFLSVFEGRCVPHLRTGVGFNRVSTVPDGEGRGGQLDGLKWKRDLCGSFSGTLYDIVVKDSTTGDD